MMAPLPLPDEQLAAVMTYVRSNFGNKAAAVTAEQVKAAKEKTKDLPTPLTRAKIEELGKKQCPLIRHLVEHPQHQDRRPGKGVDRAEENPGVAGHHQAAPVGHLLADLRPPLTPTCRPVAAR